MQNLLRTSSKKTATDVSVMGVLPGSALSWLSNPDDLRLMPQSLILVVKMKTALETDGGDVCSAVRMDLKSQNYTLAMVKMVNLILGILPQ